MTDTGASSTPAAAAPAGSPTHVSQTHQTDYQSQSGTPQASPAPAASPTPSDAPAASPAPSTAPTPSPQPTGTPPATPAPSPAPASEFKIPDEYKDKPWAAKIKSQDDLYKQIDTLDALKGKKSIVPNLKEASPEDREAFYAQLRGKDASEYPIPVNPAFPTPPETQAVVADLFMKNGVSPVQAEAIIKGYQEMGAKQLAEQFNPDGFKKSMETAFGADWQKTTGQIRNTIKGMMNADDAKALDTLPNNMLGVVYRTMGNVIKAYGIKETDSAHFATTGKAAATDINSLRQSYRDQLSALSMRPHTSAEVQEITNKLADTYKNDPRLQQVG